MEKSEMSLPMETKAIPLAEQRAYKRQAHSALIFYEFYQTNNFYQGMSKNRSMGGMCFEADFALPKGVEIFIKLEKNPASASGKGVRNGYHAEVRWCRKKNASQPPKYEVGVNYFEPVLLD